MEDNRAIDSLPEQAKTEPNTTTVDPDIDDAPDPEEEDLDDLDDVLDEFSAPPPPSSNIDGKKPEQHPPTAPAPKGKASGSEADQGRSSTSEAEDEFAKRLEAGMAELLGELESSPEMRHQLESLVQTIGDAAGDELPGAAARSHDPSKRAAPSSSSSTAPAPEATDSFPERIQRTMQRMQESGDQATLAATASATTGPSPAPAPESEMTEEFLAEMLRQLQTSAPNPDDPDADPSSSSSTNAENKESEEEFSKILLGMMEQLTNKEILYEPMKELHDKFPTWLRENADKISDEDRRRYEEQRALVREIVGKFEERGYSDEKAADREWIVVRMQKMQAAGAPPPDLVGNMSAAQEAIDELDSGCPQQ